MLWRIAAALLLALLAALYTTRTSQAAPAEQAVEPCLEPGLATIIDPVGGAVQVRMYSGANPNNVENYPTSIERIELEGGTVVYGYCVDSTEARLSGITVCLLAPINDIRLTYLIAKYPPTPLDRISQAAQQAAIWHFSNGINLDLADATTEGPAVDAAVVSAYTALLDEINAIDPENPPAILSPGPLDLAIDPVAATNQLPAEPDHPITVTLTKGGLPLAGIQVQVASNFGVFDQATATTDNKGEAQFVISSNLTGTANITATALVTLPVAYEYVVKDNPIRLQPFGIPGGTVETVSATASKEWRTAPPPPPGRITLTKETAGTVAGEEWAFSFTLDGGSLRIATNAAPQVTWEDLVPNRTYTLEEVSPGVDWSAGPFVCAVNGVPTGDSEPDLPGYQIAVTPGADVSCTVTNTKIERGRITVTKNVAGTTEDWSFVFTLDGEDERVATKAAPTVAWEELIPNRTYTLAEEDAGADWAEGTFACEVNGVPTGDSEPGTAGFQIDVEPGDDVTCSITNTRVPPPPGTGVITVTKQVFGTTEDWAFTFTLDGNSPRTATQDAPTVVWSNLEPGNTYTLAEVSPGSGWSVGTFVCTVNGEPVVDAGPAAGFQIEITPGASVVCTIDNTRVPPPDTGVITVTKQVSGTTENWAFTFTLDGANPRTATKVAPTVAWNRLEPRRTYTLAETSPGAEWSVGQFVCAVDGTPVADADATAPGFQVLVTPGAQVVCSITNTKVPPPPPARITLTKVVTQTKQETWSFAFVLTALDGSNPQLRVVSKAAPTTVWNNLTPGATYILSEQVPGAPWVEGNFACTLRGEPVGDAETNGPITLAVNAGDDIICTKNNVDLSSTSLDTGEEPWLNGKNLFLPLINP
jgi:hypothetical protein